jgi:hypothetical protein
MDLTRFEGNSTVENATSLVLPESDYTPDFLFINATSGSPIYRAQDRHIIRSQARKYASKRTKAEIGQRTRKHVLAPRNLSHNLLKTLPRGRNCLSNASAVSGQSSIRRHGTLNPEIPNVNDSGKEHVWHCRACEEQRKILVWASLSRVQNRRSKDDQMQAFSANDTAEPRQYSWTWHKGSFFELTN